MSSENFDRFTCNGNLDLFAVVAIAAADDGHFDVVSATSCYLY